MKKILLLLPFLFLAITHEACSPAGKADNADTTVVRLGVLPTMECLPFYYADSIGLLDSLNIELITFNAAMDADTAFANGVIDGVVTDLVKTCVWSERGDSLHTALTTDLKLWLITAANARLTQTTSIKEKIVGITRNSATDFFTDKLLASVKLQSIDLNKPQINNIRLRTLMLDQNEYDGAILPEPFASEAVARGAKRLTGTDDLGLQGMMTVVFNDSTYKKHKETIDMLTAVYDQAVHALSTDSTVNRLDFFPSGSIIVFPDSLFNASNPSPTLTPSDSLLKAIRLWAVERDLIKK